jgi:predicted signal transduction protein with EAL and GGDEF domain
LVEEGEEADTILDLADRIATSLNEPMLLAGERVTLGASIGVALSDGVSSPENLLRNADLAMYVAKRDRKGHYALFAAPMNGDSMRAMLDAVRAHPALLSVA